MAERKIGAGSLQAMGRLGLQELRNTMYAGSNVAAPTEKGMYGTALISDVQEQRSAEPKSESRSIDRDDNSPVAMPSERSTRSMDGVSPAQPSPSISVAVSAPLPDPAQRIDAPSTGPVPAAAIHPSTTPGLDALRAPAKEPVSPTPEPEAPEMERE